MNTFKSNDMIHEFRTKIKSSDISYYNETKIEDYNNESEELVYIDEITVVWQIEFELREYGIKSAIASVIDFEFNVYQDDYTDPDTNELLKGFEHTFKKDDTWKVKILADNFRYDNISLSSCEIDFDEGEIEFY